MYCDITRRITADLEKKWMRKLSAVNAMLDDTRGLQDYMRVLRNESKWNSLSFSLRRYADLLYRMTLKNNCYDKRADGSWDKKKGAIQKQQYLNYLSGRRPYRKNLFPLAVALGFDAEDRSRVSIPFTRTVLP